MRMSSGIMSRPLPNSCKRPVSRRGRSRCRRARRPNRWLRPRGFTMCWPTFTPIASRLWCPWAAVRHIVARSCRLKADVVERDEREESGLRAVLNYGHTFAHAFEAVGGYGAWLHGEAVAAGMACAAHLAARRGLIAAEISERQD